MRSLNDTRFSISDSRFSIIVHHVASIEHRVLSIRLILSTLLFLISITNVASANTPVAKDQILSPTNRTDPNGLHRLELIRAEMSSPKGEEAEEGKAKLRRMIEQVRSIRFESEKGYIEAPVVNDDAPVSEPNEPLSDVSPQRKATTEKIEIEPPDSRVSDLTLTMLKKSLQYPDKLKNPFELGEILFFSGHVKEAVLFYQEALKRIDPDDVRLSQDRAWILFQIGNCLRYHELPAAAETYRKLLVEYPNSPWTDLATVQREVVDWRLKEKPHEWIAEPKAARNQGN